MENIIEGNRIIAEFMGSKRHLPGDIDNDDPHYEGRGMLGGYLSGFQYHSSWDWLHPVLEKIWSLGSWEYTIVNSGCSIFGDHQQPPYISGQGITTIEATWSAVIQFIQWYNTQKTNP